jgi:AraC family transcriptional regulator
MNQVGQDLKVAEDVIKFMSERLSETVRIDDLARTANYSKFHFCRLFRKATGITPSRFLSALRLQEARRLLLCTELTVCEVSCEVGYNSVGTFTSRFTRGVGLPPSVFRAAGGYRVRGWRDRAGQPGRDLPAGPPGIGGELVGPPAEGAERIIVAAFPGPIPEGQPVRCVVRPRTNRWLLPSLPDGTWFVAAAAITAGDADELGSPLLEERTRLYGCTGPVRIRSGRPAPSPRLRLHPVRPADPPILFAPPRHPTRCYPDVASRPTLAIAGS